MQKLPPNYPMDRIAMVGMLISTTIFFVKDMKRKNMKT